MNIKKIINKQNITDYTVITFAIILCSIGIYFFNFANGFSMGGVSGLSLLLSKVFESQFGITWLTPSLMTTGFNAILLVVGFIFLGREFGTKTVYGTILLSGLLMIYPLFFQIGDTPGTIATLRVLPFTENKLLEAIFAVMFTGCGGALLFNRKASGGGSDVIAMIVRKKMGLDSGKALLVVDSLVVAGAFLVFDTEIAFLCLLGLLLKSLIIDNVIESINRSKYFLIVTSRPEPVKDFITMELKRGATYWKCGGAFNMESGENKFAIIAIMKSAQAKMLRRHINEFDPHAFVIVMNTSDIIGGGFKNINE